MPTAPAETSQPSFVDQLRSGQGRSRTFTSEMSGGDLTQPREHRAQNRVGDLAVAVGQTAQLLGQRDFPAIHDVTRRNSKTSTSEKKL
jgi:hypothetical protein